MSISEILAVVRDAVTGPSIAVLLYGSYARGDQSELSDIDILQVTPTRRRSYSNGQINVTCYTAEQLMTLASSGSMFARHVVSEAVPLIDPDRFFDSMKTAYVPAKSYDDIQQEVLCAIPIVAIPIELFNENAHHYAATAGYLLRTYTYVRAFTLGETTFSMRRIANRIGDSRIREELQNLRMHETYDYFRRVVDLLFELTNTKPFQRTESLEAFLVNSYGRCELATILGLRILARGDLLSYAFLREMHV